MLTRSIILGTLSLLCLIRSAGAAELKLLLPLQRTAYQTNERIDIAVQRSDKGELPAGELVLTLDGNDCGKLSFTFAVKTAKGSAVEHLHVNGWLLRPGRYTVTATAHGATAKKDIEVYGHVRRSSYRLINWGRAKGKEQLCQGEDNLGYNLFYGHYGQDEDGNFIRAGVDFMANCTMGGGHQMDLRMDCDWSDPYVIRGGTRRVVKRAFIDRTRPNVPGVHFYDEPGLTWRVLPNKEMTPHGIPSQVRSYEAAGHPLADYMKIDPKNPLDRARWRHWARWKLGFMDAAWKDSQFGVQYVRPDYLCTTQSQYGWTAYTDGYYFNVVRSLPVISGHGGYHDFGPGYFNPSMFLEMARARDYSRPNWYLPTWYGNTNSDQYRLEQNLSFMTNLQGMMSPPDMEPGEPSKSLGAAGIVETNQLMGRVGTIFTTMPVTRPPIALLYSLSNAIQKQTEDRKVNYAHDTPHGRNLVFSYLAGKLLQQQFLAVVDEDILDGTLAAHHKAIVLTSLEFLDPPVVAALEKFAANGGLVLLTGDCKLKIKGGVYLGVTPGFPDAAKIAALTKAGKTKEVAELTKMRQALAGAKTLADAIKPHLKKAKIRPIFECNQPGICATRQSAGDIEYIFAVNATHDPQGDPMLGMTAVDAFIALPVDDRTTYDAILGGEVKFVLEVAPGEGNYFSRTSRFGPGQLRVFARTARPIGGVKTGTPLLRRDFTQTESPLRLEVSATLLDDKGGLLTGSAPLRIQVIEPSGRVRYDLYRSTDGGVLRLSLPLALNDPAGKWSIRVNEMLNNTSDTASFEVPAITTCAATAGGTRRAVHVAQDRDNVFRFFRVHNKVAIVKGSADHYQAAAERLARILKPWNVTANIVSAADAGKPRTLTAEEAETWIGLPHTNKGQLKAGDKNDPVFVGFAVQGPVILLGTPEDNPLIKFLDTQRFLPYAAKKGEYPGPGRGYIAWQRDGIGVMQESITLIAHDAAGLEEAVGSLYEMAAGIEPLTPLALPAENTIAAGGKAAPLPAAKLAWKTVLPDRIASIASAGEQLKVLTHGQVEATVSPAGEVKGTRQLQSAEYQKLAKEAKSGSTPAAVGEAQKRAFPQRRVKFAIPNGDKVAIAYWGGTVRITDAAGKVLAEQRLTQDVTALAWSGGALIVGDADGRLMKLETRN